MTSLHALLAANQRGMRAYAMKLCKSPWVADDLVQSANVAVLTKGLPDEPLSSPLAWLNSFVFWAYRSRWLSEKQYQQPASEETFEVAVDGAQEAALDLATIEAALAAMPTKQAAAFRLIAIEGFTSREAAVELGYADHKGALYQFHKAEAAVLAAVE